MNIQIINVNNFSLEEFNLTLSLMDEKRKNYINSLKHERSKLLSVAAEWTAKSNAARLLNKEVEEITLIRDQKGKPYIKNNPLYISISHSGDFVAVALHSAPVGIDIEVLRSVDLRLKNRICTDSDSVFLKESKSAEEENLKILKIWTAKEAYFKKIGTGITNFKSISYKEIKPCHRFENNLIITTVI